MTHIPEPPEPTRQQVLDAITSLGESFHDLNLNVLALQRRHDERVAKEESFQLSLFRMLDGMDARIRQMQERIDAQFDQAWREIEEIRASVTSLSEVERSHHRDLEIRIRQLEGRITALEQRIQREAPHVLPHSLAGVPETRLAAGSAAPEPATDR